MVTGLRPNGQKDVLRAFQVKETSTFSDINADLKHIMMELDAYQPDLILADLGYNGNKVVQLQHYFGEDKVFGVHVNPSSSRGEVKPVWNLNSSKVTIDKLTQNIANINEIKSGKWGFWKEHDKELEQFVLHFSNLIIRDEEDDNGDFYKIITRKGADHFSQCLAYANVGIRKLQDDALNSSSSVFASTVVDMNPMSNQAEQAPGTSLFS